jgi:two-component system, LytTR family, sensor kinase
MFSSPGCWSYHAGMVREFTARAGVRQFFLLFVLYSVVGLMFAIQWYSYDVTFGHAGPFLTYLRWNYEQWYAWLLLSPLVLLLAARRPIDPARPWKTLPLHLVASVLVAFLALLVQALLGRLLEPKPGPVFGHLTLLITKDLVMGILAYWGLTILAQTLHYYKESSMRQVRASQLEQQLATAQLQVLQMQLHPHFLFNTLHAIGTLIREDPDAAEQMLLDLGALLRVFLEQEASQLISLRRELHLVELYLNIQKIRFRDRLSVSMKVDPGTLDFSVPSLILQPLVENAIVHGIAARPGSDEIQIRSYEKSGSLRIEILNANSVLRSGVSAGGEGWGVGLSNSQKRLARLFNSSAWVKLEPQEPRGVICCVSLPLLVASPSTTTEEALLSL